MADFMLPQGAKLGEVMRTGEGVFQTPAGAAQQPQMQAQPPDEIGQLKEFLTQTSVPPETPTIIEAPVALAQKIGEYVAPGSVPELMGQLAAFAIGGPLGTVAEQFAMRAGIKLVPQLAGALVRTLVPAGAEAVGTFSKPGATPQEALQRGMEGAKAGIFGEIAGSFPLLLRQAYKKFGHFETRAFNRAVRNEMGPVIADAVAKDIPSLARVAPLRSTKDLDQLTTRGVRNTFGREFDRMDQKVITDTGNAMVDIPIGVQTLVQPGNIQANMAQVQQFAGQTTRVPMDEAIKMIKIARDLAYNKMPPGTAGHPVRELVRDATDNMLNVIGTHDRRLAQQYRQLRNDWGSYVELKDVFEGRNSDFFPSMPDGKPTVNLPLLYNTMRDEISDPSKFQNLFNSFEGGIGAGPVRAKGIAVPRVVAGGRGIRVAESVPMPTTLSRVQLTPALEKMMDPKFLAQLQKGRRNLTTLAIPSFAGTSGEDVNQ